MFLGIEIGGTKLQLGVGSGDGGKLAALERLAVEPQRGAEAIRQHIERIGRQLIQTHDIRAVGIGFGGPIDSRSGRVVTSFQVPGWDGFPLVDWCEKALGRRVVMANDADTAGLAEARIGAGRGHRVVFYITVGSGIGGGLLVDGMVYQGGRGIASELGHLRPGILASEPEQTVESIASGWGITRFVRARVGAARSAAEGRLAADLLQRCGGQVSQLTTQIIVAAAEAENGLAREALYRAHQTLGWAIAQMIALLAPEVVVIGGGVSLVGEEWFFAPLRREVARYVYRPLSDSYRIVPAALGEEVVVRGALALASPWPQASQDGRSCGIAPRRHADEADCDDRLSP